MKVQTIVAPKHARKHKFASIPLVAYNGGPLIPNVEVTTIYWGSAWQSDPLRAQLDGFFDFIVSSSLIDQLSEYSVPGFSIGHGSHVKSVVVSASPGSTIDDTAIQSFVQSLIANQTVPAKNANSLYFVFTPSGTTVTLQGQSSCTSFCGYHDTPDGSTFYAVVPYLNCSGCALASTLFDSMTVVASHELSEAITDPKPGTGWVEPFFGFEIGDICEGTNKTITKASVLDKAAGTTYNVSVAPTSVVLDGTTPANLTVTLTPAAVVPPPPPPPPPPTTSYVIQTEWSNAAGACV